MYDDCSHCKHCKEELKQIDPDWRVNPICMTPGCIADENPWDNVFTKKAHYTYEDDPDYPDDPITLQHCDYPGCQEVRNMDNPVIYNPLVTIDAPDGEEKHYCQGHIDDNHYDYNEDICLKCGEVTHKNYYDTTKHRFGHHPKCPVLKTCPMCLEPLGQYGQCKNYIECNGKADKLFEKEYGDAWGFGDSQ